MVVSAASTSASALAKQVGGLLLSSTSRSAAPLSAALAFNSFRSVRYSHVGSAPLDVPPSTTVEVLPFPPHPNPSRPLLPSLRRARSVLVRGPKGEVVVPLHDCVVFSHHSSSDASTSTSTSKSKSPSPSPSPSTSASASASVSAEAADEWSRISLSVKDSKQKKQRSTWGLTRALLANALTGVSEGHTVSLQLVGVGYRASIEPDPLPRLSKLDIALASPKSFFFSEDAKQAEIQRATRAKEAAEKLGDNVRLHIRLGYSHPVLLPVPYGIQVQIPQPNRIVLKGADKEQLGLFASQIRSWRKPEPYKGKGIFVDNEIIRLKTPKKK